MSSTATRPPLGLLKATSKTTCRETHSRQTPRNKGSHHIHAPVQFIQEKPMEKVFKSRRLLKHLAAHEMVRGHWLRGEKNNPGSLS